MEELKQQIDDYNRFLEQVARFYYGGIRDEHQAVFIEWIMANIGRLFMKYKVLGDPEEVLARKMADLFGNQQS